MLGEHISRAGPFFNLGSEFGGDMAEIIIDLIPGISALNNHLVEILIEDIANNANSEIWLAIEK